MISNTVIIGDCAFDTNKFCVKGIFEENIKTNLGGSLVYASIPASLFFGVSVVSNVGYDFPIEKFKKYNIDTKGIKIYKEEKTTRFYNELKSFDGQERETKVEYNKNLIVKFEDIPHEYLNAKYFHIATMNPKAQLELVKQIRANTEAIISVDTIEGYDRLPETLEVFDIVDIAFIDKEFQSLLDCKAKTKIIKLGKTGCEYINKDKKITAKSRVINNVVDKTGAGDCQNGVFINLISHGVGVEKALNLSVKVASLSILDYGIFNLKNRIKNSKDFQEMVDKSR